MSADYKEVDNGLFERAKQVEIIKQGLNQHYEPTLLTDNMQIFEAPAITDTKSRTEIMNGTKNEIEGVEQYLRCIVKVGTELLSCVDVIANNDRNEPYFQTIITRFIPGQRAEFVGFLDREEAPMVIGRDNLDTNNKSVSREHVYIAQNEEGTIGIVDANSTNHTEVFGAKINPFGKHEIKNPTEEFKIWSLKSSEAKQIVLDRNQVLYQR